MGENIILSPISLDQLSGLLASIVRQEIQAAKKVDLQEKLYTKSQAAELFGVSEGTIDNWHSEGKLKAHYQGRRVYFKYSELVESLKTLKKYSRRSDLVQM